jgi:VanZ family protein
MRSIAFRFSIARPLAWACVLTIVMLSLVPGDVRPHTGFPGRAEHFMAYAGTGLLFALGYRGLGQRMLALIGTAIASGAFEVLQSFVPGRSPSFLDALASTSGLAFGLLSGAILSAVVSRRRALRLAT